MGKERLYLVRRDLETFTGPLTSAEMAKAMERMSIGLRDEVCGHCGPWVFLDDRERVRRFYPELVPVIQAVSGNDWSTDVATFRNEPTVRGAVPLPSRKPLLPARRWMMAAAFFGLAVIAALVAWFLAGSGELSSRIVGGIGGDLPATTELESLLAPGQEREFVSTLGPGLPRIIDRSLRKRETLSTWLPYLRAYAFLNGGEIEGFPAKKLRGEPGVAAPADCSVASWRKRWQDSASRLRLVTAGGELPSDHWGRILAWDPWWITRRTQTGWIRPRNFYQGCVTLALRAFDQPDSVPGARAVRERLERLAEAVNSLDGNRVLPHVPASPGLPTVFGLWSCMDTARNRVELDHCLDAPWQDLMNSDYNRERFYWSMLRLAVRARMAGDNTEWTLVRKDLEAFLAGRDSSDSYTRLDYAVELHFIGAVNGKLPGDVDAITSSPVPEKSASGDIQVELAH